MKYAVITPPAGLSLVREFNLGYHFVLSQYCDDFEYRTFYRNAHARGHFIMIDNGAAELGASVKLTQMKSCYPMCWMIVMKRWLAPEKRLTLFRLRNVQCARKDLPGRNGFIVQKLWSTGDAQRYVLRRGMKNFPEVVELHYD